MNLLKLKFFLRDCIIITCITVLSLAFICATVDIYAHFFLGIRVPGYQADKFFAHHPTLGQFHKPLAEGLWYRYRDGTRYSVAINEHGFSDISRKVQKEKRRVAIMGDSTAQFWEMNESQRPHHIMQQELGDQWEVLNFGVRGFGLDQSLVLYEAKVKQFQPDVVVLTTCINDVWDHWRAEGKPYFDIDPESSSKLVLKGVPVAQKEKSKESGWQWFLWNNSFSLRYLGLVKHPELKTYYPLDEHFELRPLKRSYNETDEELAELNSRLIGRFASVLRQNGVQLILVEMPYRPILNQKGRDYITGLYGDQFLFSRWSDQLATIAQNNDIPFVSMTKLIQDEQIDTQLLFHPEDQLHMNEEGARLFSRAMLRTVKALELTP